MVSSSNSQVASDVKFCMCVGQFDVPLGNTHIGMCTFFLIYWFFNNPGHKSFVTKKICVVCFSPDLFL